MRSSWLLLACMLAAPCAAREITLKTPLSRATATDLTVDDLARHVAPSALSASSSNPSALAAEVIYRVYEAARLRKPPFDDAFRVAFREEMARTDDATAALVDRVLGVDLQSLRQNLDAALSRIAGKTRIAEADAVAVVQAYRAERDLSAILPLAPGLIAEDDARRYLIDLGVAVRMPDGATVCAMIVRPRAMTKPLPTLLNFTIYNDPGNLLAEARRTASHGYVGVEGLTRGKGCSPDAPVPYEHDGADAAALIDWIATRKWSDGRVGMYGGSYEGFTQWAAAKYHPKALQALMPSVAAAPGIDVPMEGNQFYSFVYYWPLYAASNKTLDQNPYQDHDRWDRMERTWYATGRPYRELPRIDGTDNPFFLRWLDHPDYDRFWADMIPQGKDFAGIDIPVLTTTGYYDDAQIGALHYLLEQDAHGGNPRHYLLIGPYDHIRGQRGTFGRLGISQAFLRNYRTDPVAQIDLGEIRYQWFDFIFKGAPRPAILKDRINYQVMGANVWKHSTDLRGMGADPLRLYFSGELSRHDHTLAPTIGQPAELTVNLADRSDLDRPQVGGNIVDTDLDRANGLAFVSSPFEKPFELSGLFKAHLAVTTNKHDFDFSVGLYELTVGGDYIELSHYIGRASYVADRAHRNLLSAGTNILDVKSGRLTSRRFAPGSRLVALFSIVKQPQLQINYGSGKDVSDESVDDAGPPLTVRLGPDSWLEVPTSS